MADRPDASRIRQATCRRPYAGEYARRDGRCHAQRLSRPDGVTWGPCWLCKTTDPPLEEAADA